tara:strand:+ start:2251 stop:2577 length:327 start_codon:yes stop_codon:yes gene_type:complete
MLTVKEEIAELEAKIVDVENDTINLVKLAIEHGVEPNIVHGWRESWDAIPSFDFECTDCGGTGRVDSEVEVGGHTENGPWAGYNEVTIECDRCWGKGWVNWKDVPDVY